MKHERTEMQREADLIAQADAGEAMRLFQEDPRIQRWFDEQRRQFIENAINCAISDDEGRRNAMICVKQLDALRASIDTAVTLGAKAMEKLRQRDAND